MINRIGIWGVIAVLLSCGNPENPNTSNGPLVDSIDTVNIQKPVQDPTAFIQTKRLPICINYSESEFDESVFENYLDYVGKSETYLNNKSQLSKNFLKKHLFSNSDTVYIQNIWDGDTVGREPAEAHLTNSEYYLLDTILFGKMFSGVILERIQSDGSLKYLCTFDKTGKLISKIIVSMYYLSGTYTNSDGGRSPRWAQTEGCLEHDMVLHISGADDKKYRIQMDGRAMEVK